MTSDAVASLARSNTTLAIVGGATLLLAWGLWLLLPRGRTRGRWFGTLAVTAAFGLFASRVGPLGSWSSDGVFYILAAVTLVSAVGTVTFQSPVYSAIWFALSLMGTAGLFLFQGAQFLGVATIVVYAGAILVTFLFVLMLAQPEGDEPTDRLSWSPALAAITGAMLVGVLSVTMLGVFAGSDSTPPHDAAALADNILSNQHVAHLGGQLFGKHLISIEVAGTLLLVALVGAVAIVAQLHQQRRRVEP